MQPVLLLLLLLLLRDGDGGDGDGRERRPLPTGEVALGWNTGTGRRERIGGIQNAGLSYPPRMNSF